MDNAISSDLYVYDRVSGTTTFVATGDLALISDDGQVVAFRGAFPSNPPLGPDLLVWRAADHGIERIGAQGAGGGVASYISGDGRYVGYREGAGVRFFDRVLQQSIFQNVAPDISLLRVSADSRFIAYEVKFDQQVHLLDRQSGATTVVSTTASGAPADGVTTLCDLSGDGRYLLLVSQASNFPGARPVPGPFGVIYRENMYVKGLYRRAP